MLRPTLRIVRNRKVKLLKFKNCACCFVPGLAKCNEIPVIRAVI